MVTFVGSYEGLAAWLLRRARADCGAPIVGPCGLRSQDWEAAIVDLYGVADDEMCALARSLPVATLGEASRCKSSGILIDYHLDRIGQPSNERELVGPAFTPLEPAFAGAGRAGDEVQTVLITVGGSQQALSHIPQLKAMVHDAFPEAELLVPRGMASSREPVALLDLVGRVDLSVSAAGLTTYELACAGIPQAAVAIVDNQSRVIQGLREAGIVPGVDLSAGDSLDGLARILGELRDAGWRRSLSKRGQATFDGRGAARAAAGLVSRWPRCEQDARTTGSTAPALASTLPAGEAPGPR